VKIGRTTHLTVPRNGTHIYIYIVVKALCTVTRFFLSLSLFRRRRQRWNKHRVKNDALSNRKKKWEERKTIHTILCIIVRRVVPLLHLNILLLLLFYYHSMRRQSTLHRILATRSLKTTLYSFGCCSIARRRKKSARKSRIMNIPLILQAERGKEEKNQFSFSSSSVRSNNVL